MTNEEWIEELYHSENDIGLFNEMHPKINELKKQHRDLTYVELVELAYIELKRKHEELINNQDLIKKYNITKIILNGDGSVPNPWYRQTGSWFQDQLNLSNKWYVFTQANSNLYKVKDDFHYQEQHNSKIKIYDINEVGNFPGLLIEFDDNGNIIKIIK